MLKIHETVTADGHLSPVFLRVDAGVLAIATADGTFALPDRALPAVMSRYGVPFDTQDAVTDVARLDLGGSRALRHVRHLAGYDVIARDYLVYESPGDPPLCALAAAVARALVHLGRASKKTDPGPRAP